MILFMYLYCNNNDGFNAYGGTLFIGLWFGYCRMWWKKVIFVWLRGRKEKKQLYDRTGTQVQL